MFHWKRNSPITIHASHNKYRGPSNATSQCLRVEMTATHYLFASNLQPVHVINFLSSLGRQ